MRVAAPRCQRGVTNLVSSFRALWMRRRAVDEGRPRSYAISLMVFSEVTVLTPSVTVCSTVTAVSRKA